MPKTHKKASSKQAPKAKPAARAKAKPAAPKAIKAAPLKKGAQAAPVALKGKAASQAAVQAAGPKSKGKAVATPKGKAAPARPGSLGFTSRVSSSIDSAGESVCREVACEGLSTTAGYCRMHYIKNWKKIKRKELILKEGKLNQYIEELVAKYPDKYIEAIRQDLAGDKDFAKVIYDLDLDESIDDLDVDSENVDSLIDNIKRDFEDEGEGF